MIKSKLKQLSADRSDQTDNVIEENINRELKEFPNRFLRDEDAFVAKAVFNARNHGETDRLGIIFPAISTMAIASLAFFAITLFQYDTPDIKIRETTQDLAGPSVSEQLRTMPLFVNDTTVSLRTGVL